jgi:CDP-L-myo-inositol myo-inositolphosphotransferase
LKGLIIAAGRGVRLKNLTRNKPLLPLLGLSLIERTILTAKQAGIDEFYIVVGYRGEEVKKRLGDGNRYGVKITYIENKEWRRGNGVSVLKAKEWLNENFILLMSDHVFESITLKDLMESKIGEDECVLVVDFVPQEYIDEKEATKVKIENDRIIDVGKKIRNYDGFDCGMFLLSPVFFEALEESIERGDETISGGVKILAEREKMRFLDIGGKPWIDIDTEDSCKKAEKMLLKGLIKPTDGPVSRYLNRRVSTRISKYLVKTNVKPNFISFLSFIVSLMAACFFTMGEYFYVLTAGLLSQFSSTIDGCDGEVARLKFQESSYGAWFDTVLDRYADAAIILGMTYGCWILNRGWETWVVGFMALIGTFMNSYTAVKYDSIFAREKKPRFGRDTRLFLIMLGALLNQIFYTLVTLAVFTNIVSIKRLLVLKETMLNTS